MSVEAMPRTVTNSNEQTLDRHPLQVGDWVYVTRTVKAFPIHLRKIAGTIVREQVCRPVTEVLRGRLTQTPMTTPNITIAKPLSEGAPTAVPVVPVFKVEDVRVVDYGGEACYSPEASLILNPNYPNFMIERAPGASDVLTGDYDQFVPAQRRA